VNFRDFVNESWKTYRLSNSPKVLLYDFYLLSYISSLILDPGVRKDIGIAGVGYSGKFFGREGKDLNEDIQHAQRTLLPFLGTKLCQALFMAICAELRHVLDQNQKWSRFKHTKNKTFRNYIRNYTMMTNEELKSFHSTRNLEKPDIQAREKGYVTSFKAAKKAIKETGSSTIDFAFMAADAFRDLKWEVSYGGPNWGEIAEGYIQLRRALDNYNSKALSPSPSSTENLINAIDHAFDLEHNNGTVLNKVNYFKDAEGRYDWISQALDLKRDASMYEIAKRASSDMRKLGLEILKIAGMQAYQVQKEPIEQNKNNTGNEMSNYVSMQKEPIDYVSKKSDDFDAWMQVFSPKKDKPVTSKKQAKGYDPHYYFIGGLYMVQNEHRIVKIIKITKNGGFIYETLAAVKSLRREVGVKNYTDNEDFQRAVNFSFPPEDLKIYVKQLEEKEG
jgi:hypothetical protein